MPVDPIVSSVVSSIVSSIIQSALTPTPQPPEMGIFRQLPDESKFGKMSAPIKGQVLIDGTSYQLSPAVQIRDELNMIIYPELIAGPIKVRYTTDFSGAINKVWILSSAEARLAEKR